MQFHCFCNTSLTLKKNILWQQISKTLTSVLTVFGVIEAYYFTIVLSFQTLGNKRIKKSKWCKIKKISLNVVIFEGSSEVLEILSKALLLTESLFLIQTVKLPRNITPFIHSFMVWWAQSDANRKGLMYPLSWVCPQSVEVIFCTVLHLNKTIGL